MLIFWHAWKIVLKVFGLARTLFIYFVRYLMRIFWLLTFLGCKVSDTFVQSFRISDWFRLAGGSQEKEVDEEILKKDKTKDYRKLKYYQVSYSLVPHEERKCNHHAIFFNFIKRLLSIFGSKCANIAHFEPNMEESLLNQNLVVCKKTQYSF